MRTNTFSLKTAGKLKFFISKWENLTQDPWILSAVKGYKLEFDENPFQKVIPNPIRFNEDECKLIDSEVSDLLEKGAIKETVHEQGEFISNIFLVKKKNGKFRPVINLKHLNQFVTYHHFKQETLDVILKGISRNSFFTSLDLTDAYFSIPIHESDRKYLKFVWKDKLYAFQCLCFGISCAPLVFTKVVKVVFSHIRSMGIDSYFYIDDSLYQAENFELALKNVKTTKEFIKSVGFDINEEKSVFVPSQRIIFLGYIIDSVQFKVFLPEDKIEKILNLSKKMLKNETVTIRELAQLIGLYSSAHYAVKCAHLFHRYLDIDKIEALKLSKQNFNANVTISSKGRSEINWWITNLEFMNGKPIRETSPNHYLQTDASLSGFGAVLANKSTQGRWNLDEQSLHINVLELKAIYFGLIALCNELKDTHICVKSDSATAVNYLNNQGGSVLPLLEITKQIWLWCLSRNIVLTATHIPGKINFLPDNLSRHFNDTSEWKLKPSIFEKITQYFFYPDIDLFASRLNKQIKKFVSWFPDPFAYATDSYTFSWHEFNPYIFPPFSQVNRVLQKIQEDQVRKAILIVPLWTTQLWYPKLLKSLIDIPLKLPQCSDLLTLVHNKQKHSMNKRKMFLVACQVSGDISLIKVFQSKLPRFYQNHGENPQTFSTSIAGRNGYCGAIQNMLVPLHQM